MRSTRHQAQRSISSHRLAGRVELCELRVVGCGPAVAVYRGNAGEVHPHRRHIIGAQLDQAEIVIKPCRISSDIAVAKVFAHTARGEQLRLVPGRQRLQVALESLNVNRRVGSHVRRVPVREHRLAGGCIDRGKGHGNN